MEQDGFVERLAELRTRSAEGTATVEDCRWLLYWLDDYMECFGDVARQRDALLREQGIETEGPNAYLIPTP
jgi:hypothetical protein